jgi:hypothetical protein
MEVGELIRSFMEGKISEEELLRHLRMDHLETLEERFRFDLGREARAGFPEAVLATNKSAEDISAILESLIPKGRSVFVTRLDPGKMDEVRSRLTKSGLPQGETELAYSQKARLLVVKAAKGTDILECTVGIIAAGTSDIPVAEEARLICEGSGLRALTAYDVGVAGLHRLLPPLKEMIEARIDVAIVVAGMEGALPSVVKGLIDVPVIGVPTSIGYGYKAGESALIAMLNSCVPGLTVMNIDNGFGAAAAAYLICRRISQRLSEG